jgi:hypothetical protein
MPDRPFSPASIQEAGPLSGAGCGHPHGFRVKKRPWMAHQQNQSLTRANPDEDQPHDRGALRYFDR